MEKIWLKSYQEGISAEIDVKTFNSIPDVFQNSVRKFGHLDGFTNMGVTQTYSQTAELVNQFASFLQNHLKLQKGERVAIMMPNLLQYPIAIFGILQAGLIAVNVNPLYTPRELEHQLNDSDATTIIVLENFANTLELVLEKTPVKNVIIASVGDLLGTLKGTIVNFVLRKVKKMVPEYRIPQAIGFKEALKIGSNKPFTPIDITLDDLAFLQYTGGTTGPSKGAMLTHGNIVANMLQVHEWVKKDVQEGKEVIVTALPLYHVFSLTANLMIFTELGAKNILITNPRDMNAFVKDIKRYPVSVITGVNTLFNALLNNEEFKKLDFTTWRLALGGGMAVQKPVADKWKALTGKHIYEAYGLTETSPAACINPLSETEYNGTIGLPIPNTDVDIRDNDGNSVPLGEPGELFIKGPQVMKGYWNNPEETSKAIGNDGFFATGDIAVINSQGYVKLVDRKKDMVVVSGFNVYPNEIEDVIAAMPEVLEVACIGVPHPKSGEALRVFIVKKDANLTAEQVIAYCRENLTGYKVPKDIVFKDDLPKTNVGKILRRALKDH